MEQTAKRFNSLKKRILTSIVLFSAIALLSQHHSLWLSFILLLGASISFFEMPALYKNNIFLKTVLYPGIPTLLLLGYSYQSNSWLHMMQPWIFAWAADITGYFAGNFFGKRLLCPTISPGKTIEGLVASLVITSCIASSFFYGIMIGLAAIGGDLFVSWIKRQAQVKDTGTLLPGHGGLLDRVDSVYGVICILAFL